MMCIRLKIGWLYLSRRSRDATIVLSRSFPLTYGLGHVIGVAFWISRTVIVILVAFQVSARCYPRPRALPAVYSCVHIAQLVVNSGIRNS